MTTTITTAQRDASNAAPLPLSGKVAWVAGATRGAGRGIAVSLGEAGATVICTGRSVRGQPSPSARPETLEETAELVTAAGGRGLAWPCDHLDEAQVAAICARVQAEFGGVDLLVNDIWGGERLQDLGVPLDELNIPNGRRLFDTAVWTHVITLRYAAPLLTARPGAVVIEITDGDHFGFRGGVFYDLAKMAVIRLSFITHKRLGPSGVTALALTPGFLRSEEMLEGFGVTEDNWQDGAKLDPNFIASETPRFVGRAVAALAGDPEVRRFAGRVWSSWRLSRIYGFTDVDGRRPDWGAHFERAFGAPSPIADDRAYESWENGPMEIAFPEGFPRLDQP